MTLQEFKLKRENYWYYYKWHTYAAIFILFVLIVSITQCASNIKPDASIMLITKSAPLAYGLSATLEKDLTQYITDLNKDGKKNVNLLNLDFSGSDPTMMQASQVKLMGELQSANSFIFLLDEASFKDYSKKGLFDKIKNIIPDAPTIDDYRIPASSLDIFKGKSYKNDLKDYYFAIRPYKGTSIDTKANASAYENAVKFLKRIVTNSKTT